jgi:hypothetical protein
LVKEKVRIDTVADGSITFAKLVAGSPTWNGAGETVIATASTGNSLRITNTGSGNSLLVEDSASTDATAFAINSTGTVLVGNTTAQTIEGITPAYQQLGANNYAAMWLGRYSANNTANYIYLTKSRSATVGTNTIVQSGDDLGTIAFYGADGTNLIQAAGILGEVDGTPGTNDMPGRLVFSTTADGASSVTERMRIDSSGNLLVGTTTANANFYVYNAPVSYAGFNTTAIFSSSATASTGTGGLIAFEGKYTSGGSLANFAAIGGLKENSTDSNYSGYLGFYTRSNGSLAAERMRIDSSGNVGIGTASPLSRLDVAVEATLTRRFLVNYDDSVITIKGGNNASNPESMRLIADNFRISTGTSGSGTERMRVDASGNVGIGTSSPSTFGKVAVEVAGTTTPTSLATVGPSSINLYTPTAGGSTNGTVGVFGWMSSSGIGAGIGFSRESAGDWGTQIRFYTHPTATSNIGDVTERMRVDATGNLLVGKTTNNDTSIGCVILPTDNNTGRFKATGDGSASGAAFQVTNTSGTALCLIRPNGNLQNANNSYGSTSDVKLKENIVDATPKLAGLMQVKVRNYNLIGTDNKQIGVIAQELEQVFPSMVEESPDEDGEGNRLETTTKSVKYSVFVPMLIKAMQELKAIVDAQAVEIAALKAK